MSGRRRTYSRSVRPPLWEVIWRLVIDDLHRLLAGALGGQVNFAQAVVGGPNLKPGIGVNNAGVGERGAQGAELRGC